jgi:hypothetical protein
MESRTLMSLWFALSLFTAMTLSGMLPTGSRAEVPSGKEQFLIYELNRVRSDPDGWAIEQGLPVDLSYVEPRAPLAINEYLVASSGFHAEEMADNQYFDHTSAVTGDQPNRMAIDAGYPLPFPPAANSIESIACGYGTGSDYSQAIVALEKLIVDEGVPSLGHRNHLLGIGGWDARIEIGAGFDSAGTYCRNYWAIHTANESSPKTFLTGVVYNDADGNDLYDEGEGLGGVSIMANLLGTISNAQGGWSLEVSDGTYAFSCAGGGFAGTSSESIYVDGQNREVDCTSGDGVPVVDFGLIPAPEPSGVLLQGLSLAVIAALARVRRGR